MASQISFYGLQSKFVNQESDIPADARQVIYYTLAIGHHVGVLDCFTCLFQAPEDDFRAWLARQPEGDGKIKLEGVLRFGEIEINKSHIPVLAPLLSDDMCELPDWGKQLGVCLQQMSEEPAFYLMVKKV